MLSAQELLAGSSLSYEVEIPAAVLVPNGSTVAGGAANGAAETDQHVRLRPLTVTDLQLATRAAKENDSLVATLMVQRALVEPEMSIAEVSTMSAGLVQYLLHQVNEISGISATAQQVSDAVEEPLAKAAFVLAKEFGWTPQEVSELTLGQILLHLKMVDGG